MLYRGLGCWLAAGLVLGAGAPSFAATVQQVPLTQIASPDHNSTKLIDATQKFAHPPDNAAPDPKGSSFGLDENGAEKGPSMLDVILPAPLPSDPGN